MYENSSLPKLLARENITIRHGNYKTAWFDIKNRVLGLPTWKDMGKDVYDLFIGHEVGHALETPYEGWHDTTEKLEGCPRSYVNVIEDARIERKIKTRYPGLVGPFNRGYKKLLELEFFGLLDDVNWPKVKLIDKINLKTKLGNLMEVPFSPEEYVFCDRSLKTESFEEVVQLVKDIAAYTKENTPELTNNPPPVPENDESSSEESEKDSDESDQSESSPLTEEDSAEEVLANESPTKEDEEEGDDQSSSGGDVASNEEYISTIQEEVSITDQIFRSKETDLLDIKEDGYQTLTFSEISKENLDKIVISWKDLKAQREKALASSGYDIEYYRDNFKAYIKDTKKNVQFAVKEFEMKKAAYQYSRATTGKSGVIDVNRLHSYKTSEDIFSQVTNLANSKSHGMILLVDYSASMADSLSEVLDQVTSLVLFCKQVNIPFDVYGFTSCNDKLYGSEQDGDMDLWNMSMPLLCSSSLDKKNLDLSLLNLYIRQKKPYYYNYASTTEHLGNTPLDQALIVSHDLIRDFKNKHRIQKMNFITFTDGDSNPLNYVSKGDMPKTPIQRGRHVNIQIQGKMLREVPRYRTTEILLQSIQKKFGVTTLGFFMTSHNKEWNYRLFLMAKAEGKSDMMDTYKTECNKEYRLNKCVAKKSILGYSEYYMIKAGKALSTSTDDFDTTDGATKSQIATAFKKYSKSKKNNKTLMTNFSKAIA